MPGIKPILADQNTIFLYEQHLIRAVVILTTELSVQLIFNGRVFHSFDQFKKRFSKLLVVLKNLITTLLQIMVTVE